MLVLGFWRILLGAIVVLSVFFIAQVSAEEVDTFPTTKDVCRVWEWPIEQEKMSASISPDLFVVRHHRAPEGDKCGPFGLSVISSEVPELGILYVAWHVEKDAKGKYVTTAATYAHQADKGYWFIAPTGYIVVAGEGSRDVVSVIVHRRIVEQGLKLKEWKIVGEYRIIYSIRTITHIILKIIDPTVSPERELHNFIIELAKTPLGEKVIKKKRKPKK